MNDRSALEVYHDLTSPKKDTEQMRPETNDETTEAGKSMESFEQRSNVPLGFCEGQLEPHQPPSLLSHQCNLKSTQQTVPGATDRSQQGVGQLRSLDKGSELVEPVASPHNLQSVNRKTLDCLEESEQREAIKKRHPLKFIVGHYGSGKVLSPFNPPIKDIYFPIQQPV